MVVLTLYPTASVDVCAHWDFEANVIDRAQDGDCTRHTQLAVGNHDQTLSTYRDAAGNPPAIPAGSTITALEIGIWGSKHTSVFCSCDFHLAKGIDDYGIGAQASGNACSSASLWRTQALPAALLSVNDINTESYTTYLRVIIAVGAPLGSGASVDLVRMVITYTEPSAQLIQLPKMGVGLMLKLEARLPGLPPFLLENVFHRGKAKSKLYMRTIG